MTRAVTGLGNRPSNSSPARLPGLEFVVTGDAKLDRFLAAVKEILEVREGARGNPQEEVITRRDLQEMGLALPGAARSGFVPGSDERSLVMRNPDGSYTTINMDEFTKSVQGLKLFQDLITPIGDLSRFDGYGPKIDSLEVKASASESMVSVLRAAYASADKAISALISTVRARLDGSYIDPANILGISDVVGGTAYASLAALQSAKPVGTVGKYYKVGSPVVLYRWDRTSLAYLVGGSGTTATVEQSLLATVDRLQGAEAQYTVKVSAGNAVAGFGLAATENLAGGTTSAFVVQADKFAVTAAYNFSQSTTPSATSVGQTWYNTSNTVSYKAGALGTGSWTPFGPKIPFGIDTINDKVFINAGVEINGSLLVNGSVNATRLNVTQLSAITADFGSITAGTVTGATVQTATSGTRVVLNSSGVVAINSSGQTVGKINTTSNTAGSIEGYGDALRVGVYGEGASGTQGGVVGRITSGGGTGVAGIGVSGSGVSGSSGSGYAVVGQSNGTAAFFDRTSTSGLPSSTGVSLATISYSIDALSSIKTAKQFESAIATGTPPLVVTSTTKVANLNVDSLNGFKVVTNSAVTGFSTATFAPNKPGSASTNAWLEVLIAGATYYVPVWSS